MLDAFKAAGAIAQLMKNKDGLREAGERVKRKLADLRCVGSAGGGAVRVTVSGEMRVLDVHMEPAAAGAVASDPGARTMVQQLIIEATNQAIERAKQAAQQELAREAEAMGLGDLVGVGGLGKLLG